MIEILRRVKDSYLKEIQDYKDAPASYRRSGLWDTREELEWTDIEKGLISFGSDKISNGISLVNNPPNKEKLARDVKRALTITNIKPIGLEYPEKFGLKGLRITINGIQRFIIPSGPRMAYYAHKINKLSKGDVVEIGGGFGGVPYQLFRGFDFKHRYVGFDIPAVGIISKFFLLSMFPDKKIMLYGEDELENYKKYDIVLLPHFAIEKISGDFDLIFNAHSLTEMGNEQISEYIKQINRLGKQFLHFNHNSQSYYTNRDCVGVDKDRLIKMSDIIPWEKIDCNLEALSESESEKVDYYENLYKIK